MEPAIYQFLVKILFTQNVYPEYREQAEKMGLLHFEKYTKAYFVIAETWEDALAQARAIGNGYSRDHTAYLNSYYIKLTFSYFDVAADECSAVSVDYEITLIENHGDADRQMPVFIVKR